MLAGYAVEICVAANALGKCRCETVSANILRARQEVSAVTSALNLSTGEPDAHGSFRTKIAQTPPLADLGARPSPRHSLPTFAELTERF